MHLNFQKVYRLHTIYVVKENRYWQATILLYTANCMPEVVLEIWPKRCGLAGSMLSDQELRINQCYKRMVLFHTSKSCRFWRPETVLQFWEAVSYRKIRPCYFEVVYFVNSISSSCLEFKSFWIFIAERETRGYSFHIIVACQRNMKSEVHLTLPKSNPLGLKKQLRLRENLIYRGSKTIENKVRSTWIDLRLRRLFDLCKFDLGRVDCTLH